MQDIYLEISRIIYNNSMRFAVHLAGSRRAHTSCNSAFPGISDLVAPSKLEELATSYLLSTAYLA